MLDTSGAAAVVRRPRTGDRDMKKELVKIKILRGVLIHGETMPPRRVIEVDAQLAKWLVDRGKAEYVKPAGKKQDKD